MSVHRKDSVHTQEKKDDKLYIRISSDFKNRLQNEAENQEKTLSGYILDIVRTRHNKFSDVITTEFEKGFKIFTKMFNTLMKDPDVKTKIRDYLSENGKPTKDYQTIMRLIKKLRE